MGIQKGPVLNPEKPKPTCRFWNEEGRLDLWVNGGVVLAEVRAPDGMLSLEVPLVRLARAVDALAREDFLMSKQREAVQAWAPDREDQPPRKELPSATTLSGVSAANT